MEIDVSVVGQAGGHTLMIAVVAGAREFGGLGEAHPYVFFVGQGFYALESLVVVVFLNQQQIAFAAFFQQHLFDGMYSINPARH